MGGSLLFNKLRESSVFQARSVREEQAPLFDFGGRIGTDQVAIVHALRLSHVL